MAWYSYFLMSVPENIVMLLVTFAFFGLKIKKNVNKILLFALLQGAVAFSASVFLDNAFKPLITITTFVILMTMIFKFKWYYSILASFFTLVILAIFEIFVALTFVPLFSIDMQEVLMNPTLRIVFSYMMIIPMLLLAFILLKFNLNWNLSDRFRK